MKNKLFIFSALIISAFVFSACTLNNQAELNKLNEANKQADQQIQENSTQVNQETGDDTEDEILQQLEADKDTNFDSEFKNLNTELNQ